MKAEPRLWLNSTTPRDHGQESLPTLREIPNAIQKRILHDALCFTERTIERLCRERSPAHTRTLPGFARHMDRASVQAPITGVDLTAEHLSTAMDPLLDLLRQAD